MTKEDYVKIRDGEELPLSLIYQYWKEVKPAHYRNLTEDEFSRLFPTFMRQAEGVPILVNGVAKVTTYPIVVEKVFKHFNNKFNL